MQPTCYARILAHIHGDCFVPRSRMFWDSAWYDQKGTGFAAHGALDAGGLMLKSLLPVCREKDSHETGTREGVGCGGCCDMETVRLC